MSHCVKVGYEAALACGGYTPPPPPPPGAKATTTCPVALIPTENRWPDTRFDGGFHTVRNYPGGELGKKEF